MKDVLFPPLAPLLNTSVELLLIPPGQQFRLPLGKIGLHGKIGLGKIQRRLIIHGHGEQRAIELELVAVGLYRIGGRGN